MARGQDSIRKRQLQTVVIEDEKRFEIESTAIGMILAAQARSCYPCH
jgi:RNA:NAD 2'-phosphotransferase (TPT1/KptA family)